MGANCCGKLRVPSHEDWLEAGRARYALGQGLKSKARGPTPSFPANEVQRIARDMLMARTTRRAGAMLVADNVKDFKLIAKFCKVRVVSGRRFFRH